MKIDMEALRRACRGDPDSRVEVNRKWLRAVESELIELQRLRQSTPTNSRLDDVIDKVFGKR